MTVEAATFISNLVPANPANSDDRKEGAEHLRLIKTILQAQFPNFTAVAVTPSALYLNELSQWLGSALAAANKLRLFQGDRATTLLGVEITAASSSLSLQFKDAAGSNRGSAITIDENFLTSTVRQMPPGSVTAFAGASLPTGFLRCNGAAVSRTTYANLFTAISTIYGVGDGATTFNLPDLRGHFVRALDEGRGVDAGRVNGSAQAQDYLSHTHTVNEGDYFNNVSTVFNGYASGDDYSSSVAGTSISGASGGAETRPVNTAMYHIIAY